MLALHVQSVEWFICLKSTYFSNEFYLIRISSHPSCLTDIDKECYCKYSSVATVSLIMAGGIIKCYSSDLFGYCELFTIEILSL